MAAAQCNYKDIDQQLKEQFIHGLNDKTMLEEMIRELTARNNEEQTTSKGVLVWAKRIEAQWVQAAILNDITKSCQFDKINMASKTKGGQARQAPKTTGSHADIVVGYMHPTSAQHMGRCVPDAERWATTKRCAEGRETMLCMSYRSRWHKTPKMKKLKQ